MLDVPSGYPMVRGSGFATRHSSWLPIPTITHPPVAIQLQLQNDQRMWNMEVCSIILSCSDYFVYVCITN